MKRLIVADAHVGQRAGDTEDMAALVRAAGAAGIGELIYLGDAFQYLIGMDKFWTASVRVVLDAWAEAREAGTRVVLVEGNRDFFLDDADLAPWVDWTGRTYDFVAGERSYRLVHGDRVNKRDLQYRFWCRVSKSVVARAWAHLLPRSLANAIVRNMEAHLATTNLKYRYRKPVESLRREARRSWQEGVTVLLWGHFHSFWEYCDGDRLAMVVPAWLETTAAVMVSDRGDWSMVSRALTPLKGIPRMD